jgi:transposase
MERLVVRTARVAVRATAAQRRRCFGLLFAAGDVWAGLIELNRARFVRGGPPVFGFAALCRELTGADVGPLARICAEDVAKRYSSACFETARRKKAGGRARYPRRKRAVVPVRFRFSAFTLDGRRLRLATAKGELELWVRLARDVPYDPAAVRAVTLIVDAGRLFVDVSAEVPVEDHDLDPGRALRAEERLHLEDTKRRSARMGRKAPRRGQRGSRRWRRLRATQRRAERRHIAKIHLAHHEAAKTVIAWVVARRVGTLVVGDPKGITHRKAGRRQNRRVNTTWRRTHLTGALTDKATRAGITVVLVDERGTSSTCPRCHQRVPKPRGRAFTCPHCGLLAHRDVIGAANIAARGGGTIDDVPDESSTTHRRAGTVPTRRDRRRHRWDTSRAARRSSPTPGRPTAATTVGSRSKGSQPAQHHPRARSDRAATKRHPPRIANVITTKATGY